ncbi:LacI family DNA-binding transcriptional regulator [Pararhizobium antarcticum]|uniref:LacI family transcriptional regulator n=1 Tax=Pararhizobium antarcticum TaxID=1798805 RepID=A0A657LYL6_9HYPH|nr:LacI family DNA-binding transcriptional regulator [Pararhizobium antarcticum]OJG00140.1 LacI family transcriptional regulator [Rhizobium sp. 58]OJG01537.1 LacI family transcriptional regulator [Pararhizobium antarcticum]
MVTIKEIAKAVGVSSATVSRVLNYDPALSISPAKRQAIIETAEALNYETPRNRNKANGQTAPSLLTKLVIVHFLEPSDEIADPYYVGVRLGIENRCRDLKTEIVKVFHSDALPEASLLEGASGVIVIGKHSDNEIEWLQQYARQVVFADFDPRIEQIDSVLSDMGMATVKILESLQANGYRRIGFIGSHEKLNGTVTPFGEKRCAAYIDWQKQHGTFDPELLALADCTSGQSLRLETGYRLARDLLALREKPDVIVTSNDNMAIGTYRAIQEAGLSIPDDIGVISFNDIPVAQFLMPPLSTVRVHGEHIGEVAVDLLLERLAGRAYGKQVRISTELIHRDSCRKAMNS